MAPPPLAQMKTDVPLIGGVDTKTDPYQIPMGKLAVAKDVIFTTPGETRTRYGYRAFPRKTKGQDRFGVTDQDLTEGQAVMTSGRELLLCDPLNLYSWDPTSGAWILKAACVSMNVSQQAVIQTSTGQGAPDENLSPNGIRVDAWEDKGSDGGVWWSATDTATGNVVQKPRQVDAQGVKPKVVYFAGLFCIFYVNTSNGRLYVTTVSSADVTRGRNTSVALTTTSTDSTKLSTTVANYDVCVMSPALVAPSQLLYLAFNNNEGGITVWGYLPNASNFASPSFGPFTLDSVDPLALTIFADSPTLSTNGPVVAWGDGTAVKAEGLRYDLTAASYGPVTAETTTATVVALTGVSVGSSSARALDLYYSEYDTVYSWKTLTVRTRLTDTSITPITLRRSVGLASKAFTVQQGAQLVSYVTLAYQSQFPSDPGFFGLQDTYFVADSTGYIVARYFYGTAGGLPLYDESSAYGYPMLPEVWGQSATVFGCALTRADFVTTFAKSPAAGTETPQTAVFTQDGVVSVTYDFFDRQNSYLRAELGQTLLLGGGLLQSYDGASLTENDFSQFPENIELAQTTGGHLAASSTYYYALVWQWLNRKGELQQSAPYVIAFETDSMGGGTAAAQLTVPTLRMTAKENVTLAVYRAQLNGTVFYSAITTTVPASSSATNAPILNDTTVDTITFVDQMSDADLASRPQLYTTGGVIENLPTPPCSDVTVNYNRLFAVDSDGVIWFSQQTLPGQPVKMSEWLYVNVDPRGGKTVAVRALDQHLVVFKESLIMAIDGIGPDATGSQGGFQEAYIITTDVGCVYPRSIGLGPQGLYFQSAKGPYLLDRSLNVTPIGAEVTGLTDNQEITSAQLISYTQQMRFTLNNKTLVGHDYFVNQWFEHTNIDAVDAVIWQGSYCYLKPDGKVMQETVPGPATTYAEAQAMFTDAGAFIGQQIVTPWMDLGGLNGWAYTWWVYILGKVFSSCVLQVQAAFDYDPTIRQTVKIPIEPRTPYGTTQPYGSGTYGGSFPNNAWRVQPRQGMSSAIQLTITVMPKNGATGQGVALSGLTFWWGQSRTPRMPKSSATFG